MGNLSKKHLVAKRPVFEAVRFDGGAENAQDVIDWIVAGGGAGVWFDAQEATENNPGRLESIRFASSDGGKLLLVGECLLRDPKGTFRNVSMDILFEEYEAK